MDRGDRVHVRALDGLRGAAVLGVLAFHLAPLDGGDRRGLLPGGWLGVDTFFTLSGFLITSLLLAEDRIDLRGFWRRRVRRLQPAALVTIVVVVSAAGWWSAAGTASAVREQALAALAAIANWQALWSHAPYAAGADPSAFEHFWSLAVEEQFYLAWPLVVFALGGRRRAVLGLAVAGTALSWGLLAAAPLQRGYLGTDTRMGSILLGAALAAVLPLGTARRASWGGPLAAAGLAVTAVAWVAGGWPPNTGLGILLPVHALATVAVLAGVVVAPTALPARVLGWNPLAGVGKVSYGIYLWHWPVFVVCTPDRLGAGMLVTTVVRLVLVAGLTWLSWHLVEHPVRRDLVLRRTRLALPGAVAVAVVAATLAVHTVDPAPAWARADGQVLARSVGTPITVDLAPEHPQRVLVVGDSIPTSLLAGDASGEGLQVGVGRLLDQLADVGIEGWGATLTGCPVIRAVIVIEGHPWRRCLVNQARVFDAGFAAARPDLVLWYARQDAHPVLRDDGRIDADPAELRRRISERVDWFAARGAKVALVAPGPNRDGSRDPYAPLGSSRRSMAVLEAAQRDVADRNPAVVGVIRMADLLCGPGPGCDDQMPGGGDFRMEDGIHFTPEGALVAGRWLADRVAELDLSAGGRPART